MTPRHIELSVNYEGVDISGSINSDLISFQYDEVAEGTADSMSLSLVNITKKWLSPWRPHPGDLIQASLSSVDWNYIGELLTLDCGSMKVDDPQFSGVPDTCTIKALNIPADEGFTDTPEDTTWTLITLQELAQLIANRYGMELIYDVPQDFTIRALKRTNQTDADLLNNTANKYNVSMKIYSNKLILYSKNIYEQRAPVAMIIAGVTSVSAYTLASPLVDAGYNGCTVTYKPAKSKAKYSYTYMIPGTVGGKVMHLNETVDDDAQAELVAKGKLREKNEKSFTGTFTLSLNLKIVAACTITLQGYGDFDGKYFVDTCSHTIGGGPSTTAIAIHRCLGGDY